MIETVGSNCLSYKDTEIIHLAHKSLESDYYDPKTFKALVRGYGTHDFFKDSAVNSMSKKPCMSIFFLHDFNSG